MMLHTIAQKYKDHYSPSATDLKVIGVFSTLYVLWNSLFVGWRNDHFTFLLFLVLCVLISPFTRKVFYAFCFFTLFWIIYDSMRVYPNFLFSEINVENLYNAEKEIFGLTHNDTRLTPNEFFEMHHNVFLDIISGLFYLTWVPVPLALGFYFFFTDRKMLLRFSAAYLFTNLLGFCIYYIYPAAPPWYFDKFGNIVHLNTSGDAAGLLRFDNPHRFSSFFQYVHPQCQCICRHALPACRLSCGSIVLCIQGRIDQGLVADIAGCRGDMVCCGVQFSSLCTGCGGRTGLCCYRYIDI
ncbi:MAG: phosphatase PAP2 family protein [Saprospiraceae bacterium]|nr:phosphatase PAP2 family protein [Saprospiraceae bacterium]